MEVPLGVVDAEPALAPDGSNGCVVATAVFGTESTKLDRYAGNGAHLWTQNLAMVQGSNGPAVATDGAGGAFAAYTALFGAEARACHVAADGNLAPPWPSLGTVICTAPNGRSEIGLTATTDGDAIAVWSDNRNQPVSNLDIYATKLEHGTFVAVDPIPVDAGAVWLAASPNPAAGACTIDFVLPAAGPASLELFAVNGRRLVARDLGALGAGRHRIVLDLDRRTGFAPGVYVARLRQGGAEHAVRLAVVR